MRINHKTLKDDRHVGLLLAAACSPGTMCSAMLFTARADIRHQTTAKLSKTTILSNFCRQPTKEWSEKAILQCF